MVSGTIRAFICGASRSNAVISVGLLLVVAIDMTLAPEAPYPASIQDANFAVRWLKANAATWNGDGSKIGVYASSSGGHVAELLALRPRDPRYTAIALPAGSPALDATVPCVIMSWPVINPLGRYRLAVRARDGADACANASVAASWPV